LGEIWGTNTFCEHRNVPATRGENVPKKRQKEKVTPGKGPKVGPPVKMQMGKTPGV